MGENFAERAAQYYSQKLFAHGATPAGVDWNSVESQDIRFEQLIKIVRLPGDDFSILDFGCGYGALLAFLRTRSRRPSYWGYDAAPAMIAKAAELHASDLQARFVDRLDAVGTVDYTIASGVFHVKQDAAADDWQSYVVENLRKLISLSKRGCAFNLLTKYCDHEKRRDRLYYADPCFFFDLCKTRFSKQVALLHDYGLYEFTILVSME